jgi:exonuclease VII large subunit
MSEEEIRTEISDKKDDITRIEEDAAKREAGAEKKIEGVWDDKINETKTRLDAAEIELKEAREEADKWVKKRDKLEVEVKSLTKQYDKYIKGKDKDLKDLLTNIEKEKKSNIKDLEKDIKKLEKQLEKVMDEKLKQKIAD